MKVLRSVQWCLTQTVCLAAVANQQTQQLLQQLLEKLQIEQAGSQLEQLQVSPIFLPLPRTVEQPLQE